MTEISKHYTVHVNTASDPGVLPRVLLVFARRQLRIQALHYYDLDSARPAELQIDLDCAPATIENVLSELRVLDGVTQVLNETIDNATRSNAA